jgi:hypothetical protein
MRKRHARHPCGASRDLNQQLDRGTLGTEDCLYARAALPSDRCRLNDMAVRVNRKYRDNPAIGEEDMVERTVSVHEYLLALAANVFKLRHKLLEIARGRVTSHARCIPNLYRQRVNHL